MFPDSAFLRCRNSVLECDCIQIDAVLRWVGVLIALVSLQFMIAVPGSSQPIASDEAAPVVSVAERRGIAQAGSLTISPVARSLLFYRSADGRYLTAAAGATPWSGLAAGARSPYLHGVCIEDSTGLAPLVEILPWLSGCEGRSDAERPLGVPPLPSVLIGGWPFVFGPAIIPAFAPVVLPHGPVVVPVVLAMRPLIALPPFAGFIPFVPAAVGPGAVRAGVPIAAHASIPVPSAGGNGATAARIIAPGLISTAALPSVAFANPVSVPVTVRPPAGAIVPTPLAAGPTLPPSVVPAPVVAAALPGVAVATPVSVPVTVRPPASAIVPTPLAAGPTLLPSVVPAPVVAAALPGVLIVPGFSVAPAAAGGAGVSPAMRPPAPVTVPTVAAGLAATAPVAGHLNPAAVPLLASPAVAGSASFITPAIAPAIAPGHPIAFGHSIGPGIVITPLPLAQSVAPIAAILGAAATASVAPLVAGGAFDIVAQALPIAAFSPLPSTVTTTGGSGVAGLYAGVPVQGSIVAVATIATPLPAAMLAQSRWGLSAPIGTALPSYPPGGFGPRAAGIAMPATASMRPLAASAIVRSVPTAHALGPALVAIAR